MSAINSLGETLAGVLEPFAAVPATAADGRRSVAATSGASVDLNLARPFNWQPNTLYAWPTRHAHLLAGAGNPPEEREDFSFQFVYTADRLDEEPQLARRRDVSDSLDTRAGLYASRIAAARHKIAGSPAPWDQIVSEIQHDTTATFGVRGIGVLVSGFRIVSY